MNNKVFAIIIAVVVLLTVLPIVIVSVWNVSDSENKQAPTIEFSLSSEEEEQEEVTITAVARTTDSKGILLIKLPDGSTEYSDVASYKVTKNGEYSFETEDRNGAKTTGTVEIKNIHESSPDNPYLPIGFSYLEGNARNGYVIKDEKENEYVWVPVDNNTSENATENEEIKYVDNDDSIEEFMNSVQKYNGFYIARYESSKFEDKNIAVTMKDKMPWTNINYINARELANNSANEFNYKNSKTALVSGYAWNKTLEFLNSTIENYSSNIIYGNYSGQVMQTGITETDKINKICDMAGNVKEWTTQCNKENNLERFAKGGNALLNKTANSSTAFTEDYLDDTLGFRMVLYKNEM